jgi:AraC family transcriptional regulator
VNTLKAAFRNELPYRVLDSQSVSRVLRVVLHADVAGVIEAPARPQPLISIHVGRPVRIESKHGDNKHSGLAIHGDIDIIPCGAPARWEMKVICTALNLNISADFLRQLAEQSGFDARQLRLRDRFQIRDPQIEHIGWALMWEIEQGYPGGSIFMESMATALGAQLLRSHSNMSEKHTLPNSGIPLRKLRQVTSYIEDNLSDKLSLEAIARIAELSVSHMKVQFRKSVGVPVHQYVIRRRVERAAHLLREGKMSISQIALETGFAHQSHLAMHMRRVLGISPRHLTKLP